MIIGLVLIALAVWRVSHALVKEKGPLDAFIRWRAFLAGKQKRSGGLFDLFSCVYCLSIYVGLLGALCVAHTLLDVIVYAFAFSGVSMLLEASFSSDVEYSNALTHVARPTTNDKVRVRGSTASKKRDDMIGDPDPHNRPPTVKTQTILN